MKSRFDHERLDVYRLELSFVTWVTMLLEDVRAHTCTSTAEVRNQLDRASISMPLNTAEGNGKRQTLVRARFFDDARGSSAECSACLDVLVAKGVCDALRVEEGKDLLFRIASMLTKLVDLYDPTCAIRESSATYIATSGEYDDEYEYDGKPLT